MGDAFKHIFRLSPETITRDGNLRRKDNQEKASRNEDGSFGSGEMGDSNQKGIE